MRNSDKYRRRYTIFKISARGTTGQRRSAIAPINRPNAKNHSAVALVHQFGPYHYEKARNSPKTPKFPSMNPKIIKGTRKLKKKTEKEAKRAILRLEEGDFREIERRSNPSSPRSRVFHSFSFFST